MITLKLHTCICVCKYMYILLVVQVKMKHPVEVLDQCYFKLTKI